MTKIYALIKNLDAYLSGSCNSEGTYIGNPFAVVNGGAELRYVHDLPRETPLELPAAFQFSTESEDYLHTLDFPRTSPGVFDVFSKQFSSAILSVGPVDWNLIPAHFNGKSGEEVCKGRFDVAIYNEFCDCLDYEKSEYKPRDYSKKPPERVTERMRKGVRVLRKIVLKEPDGGFPPLFRLLASPAEMLITEDCKRALEHANINGLRFYFLGEF